MFETKQLNEKTTRDALMRPRWLIVRFVLGWLLSLVILAVLALMIDIDWAKPRLEAAIGETMHRKVHLGRLRWHFGLNGIILLTRSLKVDELDGDKFVEARGSNIAIAFTPLLRGKLVIKSVQIDHPQIWAIKLKPGAWNFEDLLSPTVDVQFIQVDSGTIYISDKSAKAISNKEMVLNNVDLKLNWPAKGKNMPLYLSFNTGSPNKSKAATAKIAEAVAKRVDSPAERAREKTLAGETRPKSDKSPLTKLIPGSRASSEDQVAAQAAVPSLVDSKGNPLQPDKISSELGYVRINGLGKAQDHTFENTNYALTITANNLQASDINHFLSVAADDLRLKDALDPKAQNVKINGTVSLKATLEGSIENGFQADVKTEIEDVVLSSNQMGQVKTKHASTGGAIELNDSRIGWRDLNLKFGMLQLKTNGELRDWQDKTTKYTVDAKSHVTDLPSITKTIDISGVRNGKQKTDELIRIIKTATLSGRAFFDLKLVGDANQAKILSKLRAEGLPVQQLMHEVAPEMGPYLALTGIGQNSVVMGQFETLPGRRIKIKDGQITVPDSSIKISGEVDLLKDSFDLNFDVDKMSLKKAWAAALRDPKAREQIAKRIKRTNLNTLFVDGIVRAGGNVKGNRHTLGANIKAHLDNGGFATADHQLNANSISGDCLINGGTLQFNNVQGKVGSTGKFTLVGGAVRLFTSAPDINLALRGTNVNFENLSTIMNLFELKFPAVTDQHLTGRVKDLLIKLTGNPKGPQVYLSASPDDIAYRPPGLTRPIRAVSGNILYEHDRVTLVDVGIISRGMRLTTSIRIDDLSSTATLRRVHVKSDGIDIGDIDYYLSSPVLPTPLRTAYKNLLDTYKIKNLHGKIYGDVVVLPKNKKDFNLEGVLGCYSVGATVSKLEVPLERIAGILAASGDELLIQDMSGYARSTHFDLDGYVKNYKTDTPSWKTELRSTIAPQEFLDLVPALTSSLMNGQVKIKSDGPFQLRAQIQGNAKKNEIIFSAHAAATDHLKLSVPIITINQPDGEELNIDGSVTVSDKSLELHSTNLLLGEASIKAQGNWLWNEPDQPVSLSMISPNPVPAKILVGLLDPTFDTKNLTGTLDGFVTLDGPVRHPKLTGKISIDRLSNPDYNLFGMTGTISTDNTKGTSDDPYSVSIARMDINHLRLRKLAINDLGGLISIESQEGRDGQIMAPRIAIKDGTARVAGGLLKMDGHLDLERRQVTFNSDMTQVHMEEISDRLLDTPGELTGAMDGDIHLTASGANYGDFIKNLEGTGNFTIKDGVVARFGQLQTKLTQANLLQQGILGFNFNNLMQSVVPVRTGEFNELRGRYSIYQGMLNIKEIRFSGDDLRMWGAGTANLNSHKIDVEIAGTIPRVTKSRLGGFMGDLSRRVTISKFLNQVTFGRLENLPSLPIIGEIASDKPRTFSFVADANMTDAKQITKSIEKSFKWLPNKQAASAHPVPGL